MIQFLFKPERDFLHHPVLFHNLSRLEMVNSSNAYVKPAAEEEEEEGDAATTATSSKSFDAVTAGTRKSDFAYRVTQHV